MDKSVLETLGIQDNIETLKLVCFLNNLQSNGVQNVQINLVLRKKLLRDNGIRCIKKIKKMILTENVNLVCQKGKSFFISDPYITCHITDCNGTVLIQDLKEENIIISSEIFKFEDSKPLISFDDIYKTIGGLDNQLKIIYNKIFFSRSLPRQTLEKFNIQHIKGMVLHGEPGCGKSLIGRQLSALLNAKEVNIINGPQLICQYIGQSEKNIRELFKNAFESNNPLDLYVYIFDEFDAISRGRGGSQSQLYDNVVNQLLTIIDGIHQNDNILFIALTNRIDLIDNALLRAGRLELQIKIEKPDQKGLRQIYEIYFKQMEKGIEFIDFDIQEIVDKSFKIGLTGADVRSILNQCVLEKLSNGNTESGSIQMSIQMSTKDVLKHINYIKHTDTLEFQLGQMCLCRKQDLTSFIKSRQEKICVISAYRFMTEKHYQNMALDETPIYVFDDADLYINKLDRLDEDFKLINVLYNHFKNINKDLSVILVGQWKEKYNLRYI